jgi:hypothetical protein
MKIRVWLEPLVASTPDLEVELVELVGTKLSRFSPQIAQVEITVRDVNGRKGGLDKLARITVRLTTGESITLSEYATEVLSAVGQAAERMQFYISKALQRRKPDRQRRPDQSELNEPQIAEQLD